MKRVNKLLSVLAASAIFMGALTGCGGGSKEQMAIPSRLAASWK